MALPLNQSNNLPTTSFQPSGAPYFGNQPTNVSWGSLYDTGGRTAGRIPIPPPRNQSYSYSSPYNNGYSSGYNSLYNRPMFSSYNPYHRQSYGTPMTGASQYYGDSFIGEAHESSREAFASIESIVNAFGSINMMIESTYCALQSSFNAVLSVAENFSRLKSQFGQILSAFTVIRTFQWLYRKLLYLIGLRKIDPTTETAWKAAARSLEDPLVSPGAKKSSWPVFMFFVAVYAAPFLMWKFIKSIMQKGNTKEDWVKENGDYYYAIAKYKYDAQNPDELSFSAGEYLRLAPYEKQADRSWPLASNGKRTGIVPINYIDVKFKSKQSTSNTTRTASKNKSNFPVQNNDNISARNSFEELEKQFNAATISSSQSHSALPSSKEAAPVNTPIDTHTESESKVQTSEQSIDQVNSVGSKVENETNHS